MEVVLQVSLLTVSVCLGAALLARRSRGRPSPRRPRIEVEPLSDSWLAEHRVRSRPE